MKQKILFYLLVFSILINLYLVLDYGKRFNYADVKINKQTQKIEQLKDSIKGLHQLKAVPLATE